MEINEDILKKAEENTIRMRKEEEYIQTCIKGKICPKCGNKLLLLYTCNEFADWRCSKNTYNIWGIKTGNCDFER